MPRISGAAAVLLAACVIVGCGSESNAVRPAQTATAEPLQAITIENGAPLIIGVSVALSGDQMNLGHDIADAATMAVTEFGAVIGGHLVAVEAADDGCTDAERAVGIARDFTQEEVLAGVIGPMCTTGAQAANKVYEAAGIIHISPSATRVDLSSQGEQYFFRTAWRDDLQARAQAEFAREGLSVDSAVVVDDGEPYGKALADAFSEAFESRGGSVMSRERIARGTRDFGSLARELKAMAPDMVVFEGLNPEGALIARALTAETYAGAFMGPDGLLNARDFIGGIGSAAEGAIVSGGAAPDDSFNLRFFAQFQREATTPFVLQTHDAVTALLRAVDAVAVRNGDGSLTIDRLQLADEMRSQRLDGLTGAIDFDERGDRGGATASDVGVVIYRVEGGRFVPVP